MSLQVWCCYSDSNPNRITRRVLDRLNSQNVPVRMHSSDKLLMMVQSYCQDENPADSVCLLLEIQNRRVVEDVCRLLQFPGWFRRPRIVLLSTLLTWAGKSYPCPIQDISCEFCARLPTALAEEAWKVENCIWNISVRTKTEVIIVGLGLLYGLNGFDFGDVFRGVWQQSTGTPDNHRIPSVLGGRNRVPMIHVDDAVDLVCYSLQFGAVASTPSRLDQTKTETMLSPSVLKLEFTAGPYYIAATDANEKSLIELFPSIQTCGTNSEMMDLIFGANNEDVYLWNSELCFTQPIYGGLNLPEGIPLNGNYCRGIIEQFPKLWKQYLAANALSPVKVIVVGGPKTGKTSVAQEVAKRLNLEYINVVAAVKYILDNEDDLREGCDMSTPVVQLRMELVAALEAGDPKKGKGAKKDKGAVDTVRMSSSNMELSDTVCAAIPETVVRKCINWKIQESPKCQMSGLLLDAWAPFISSYEQLYEAVVGSAVRPSCPDSESGEAPALVDYVEVIIELQVSQSNRQLSMHIILLYVL
jgi:hypothetical protein